MSARKHLVVAGGLLVAGGALTAAGVAAQTTTYKYDALGRLTEVHRVDGFINEYNYDDAGNRQSVQSYPSSLPPPPPSNGPFEAWMVPVLLGG